jgi:mevalonate kinase
MMEHNLDKINNDLKKNCPEKDQYFFGHGKLLLTSEYFVLEGAQALALPTKVGQSLSVKYGPSFSPTLNWKSFDVEGNCWFEASFEFWQFRCLDENPSEEALFLQKILQQVRKQNPHFLRDEVDVKVETRLGFPLKWGLGSSSSLVYNIAQWAYVSPFELLFKTQGGSGYDIACAQSDGPILYRKIHTGPNWSPVYFSPSFKNNLYFIYQGNKKDSRQSIKDISTCRPFPTQTINRLSEITHEMMKTNDQFHFNQLIVEHEDLVSSTLGLKKLKDQFFNDFFGEVKSLGAWGGDFFLASSNKSAEETKAYFNNLGFDVFYRYSELVAELDSSRGFEAMNRHDPSSLLQ